MFKDTDSIGLISHVALMGDQMIRYGRHLVLWHVRFVLRSTSDRKDVDLYDISARIRSRTDRRRANVDGNVLRIGAVKLPLREGSDVRCTRPGRVFCTWVHHSCRRARIRRLVVWKNHGLSSVFIMEVILWFGNASDRDERHVRFVIKGIQLNYEIIIEKIMYLWSIMKNLLVQSLGGLVKSVYEAVMDESSLQHFLKSCVHVHGTPA